MTDKEKIRAEIERLMYAYNQEADIASAEDSIGEKVAAGKYDVCKHLLSIIDSMQKEPVSKNFEMALAEMIDKAQANVVESWVIAAQWKDELIKLAKSEEPVSGDLEEAAKNHAYSCHTSKATGERIAACIYDFKAGAKWQKIHLWKPADGNDLPEYEREIVVFTQPYPLENSEYVVSFAHRPNPDGWDGKSLATGKIEHYTPKTYGEGGWNIPDVKWWLDVELPKD